MQSPLLGHPFVLMLSAGMTSIGPGTKVQLVVGLYEAQCIADELRRTRAWIAIV
jgi:hypothetical protein